MTSLVRLTLLSLLFAFALSQVTYRGGQRSLWIVGSDLNCISNSYDLQDAAIYDAAQADYRNTTFIGAYEFIFDGDYQCEYPYDHTYPVANGQIISETVDDGDFTYIKQFYISPTLPVIRVFTTFIAHDSPVILDFAVHIKHALNAPFVGDFSNNDDLDSSDMWYITGTSTFDSVGRPTGYPYVSSSIFGPGASVTPYDADFDGYGDAYYAFDLDLEPGVPQSFLFFSQLALTSDQAFSDVTKFVSIPDLRKTDLLFGLSSSDLDSTVNWGLQTTRKVSSYTGICDFADEIKNRVSKLRSHERHSFTQPWKC